MKAFDYEAVAFDADVYCCHCLPDGVSVDSEEVSPIFADSEWDYVPVCCNCGASHDYVNLLPPTFHATKLNTWFERDRSHVELVDKRTGQTIIEWWDDDVTEAVEDGFLDPRHYHESAFLYAKESRKI